MGSLEPIQAEEMRLFTQMICLIRQAGHQVYLCLNSGIAHIAEDSGSEEQVAAFLRSTQQCVNAASDAGALVDLGTGFWTQHIKMWSDGGWFSVREKEDVLAQIIDSFILRQKVLLHLAVNKEVVEQFDQMSALNLLSLEVFETPWPDGTEVTKPEEFFIDTDDEQEEDEDVAMVVSPALFQDQTKDQLAISLELEEEGQQRYWIRREESNCCEASVKSNGPFCEKASACLICNALKETKSDAYWGLIIEKSVASLCVHAQEEKWHALPDDTISTSSWSSTKECEAFRCCERSCHAMVPFAAIPRRWKMRSQSKN